MEHFLVSTFSLVRREEQCEDTDTQLFQVGDSVVALANPATEGIIINVWKSEERKIELMLIVAGHQKRGNNWSKATVCLKNTMKLSKKFPAKFIYPIENSEKIRAEAKTADACLIWINNVLETLNATNSGEDKGEARDAPIEYATEIHPVDDITCEDPPRPRRSTEPSFSEIKIDDFEQRMAEVIKLKKGKEKKKKTLKTDDKTESSESSGYQRHTKEKKKRHRKRKGKKHHNSSSSDSSSTSSSSSSSDDSDSYGEVREKGRSGMFSCPFSNTDNRGYKEVKTQLKGQAVARKYIRIALHNLYSESHSMETLATSVVTLANASGYKPFATDVAWLHLHAKYLDGILLNALAGPWTTWNEAWLDDLVIVFLVLMVRISSTKEYPVCLDDRVRKWMRKRKVGINPKFGPVPQFMQQAKLIDNGLLLFQGARSQNWDNKNRTAAAGIRNKGGANPLLQP